MKKERDARGTRSTSHGTRRRAPRGSPREAAYRSASATSACRSKVPFAMLSARGRGELEHGAQDEHASSRGGAPDRWCRARRRSEPRSCRAASVPSERRHMWSATPGLPSRGVPEQPVVVRRALRERLLPVDLVGGRRQRLEQVLEARRQPGLARCVSAGGVTIASSRHGSRRMTSSKSGRAPRARSRNCQMTSVEREDPRGLARVTARRRQERRRSRRGRP